LAADEQILGNQKKILLGERKRNGWRIIVTVVIRELEIAISSSAKWALIYVNPEGPDGNPDPIGFQVEIVLNGNICKNGHE